MNLGLSGLASGFDWHSLIDQLSQAERVPEQRLQESQSVLQRRKAAYSNVAAALTALKTRVDALKDAQLFSARLTQVGDDSILTASAAPTAALGTYTFNFTQLATTSVQRGVSDAGARLNATNDVSGLVLSNAGLAASVTAGTLTVNGKQVTVATSDTLQQVLDKISTATGGAVTGSYDSASDKITLASASEIVLGSATDTSNFLQAFKLNNNGTNTISSSAALGVVNQSAKLAAANFATAVSDGGSGAGQFKINGVAISFNATTDTVYDVLARINSSAANVTVSYDPLNDRFQLTNKSTGDVGMALEDVTGNFLAATQLSTGTLSRGKNLLYTINGGSQLVSQSNIVTSDSSNLTGLSVTALKEASTTVQVSSDTAKIKSAITDFLAEYNKSQSLIDSLTASTTDAKGKVTAGILAGESEPNELASKLRSLADTAASDLSGTVKSLAALGIDSNGTDNTLALKDSTKLDSALASHLNEVQDLFTNATNGLAVQLSSYLDRTVGDQGSLVTKQDNLTTQIATIDTQISDQEKLVQANADRLTTEFLAMEQAQATANQQLAFLSQRFGASTSG